jgi:plastocyanin
MNAMKKFLMLGATVCLAAAVAACGSESSYTTTEGDTGTATATSKATTNATEATSAPAEATSPASEATGAPAEATGATITIANMSFGEPLTVAPGAEVTVKNDDSAEHSVTSQTEGVFDEHVDGGEQDTFTAPTEPGEYAFYCVYHPSMKGTLIVK